ncbi:MAG TPA: CAP domain-containing protein [Steroidobacteraceae bacterium]|nr:CAP domain-containing protein [Steroidobacteraceae bacterium]
MKAMLHDKTATLILIVLLLFGSSLRAAHADALAVINDLRRNGCSSASPALQANAQLNDVAKQLANRTSLRAAMQRSGYRADQSSVIRIGGVTHDASLKRLLSKNYCSTIADRALTQIGVYTKGKEVSIVFAAPFAPPATGSATVVANEVLQLVNKARAQARRCGNKRFSAAGALSANTTLTRAAAAHAKDMAVHNQVAHEGSDGSSPGVRATRAGYAWKSVGENVAAGQLSAAEVVEGWLSSPGHCSNIMDADFKEMGIAFVVDPKTDLGIYWAQLFGRP